MHPDRASTRSQRYLAQRRTCRKARWRAKVGEKQDSVERTMSKLRSYPVEVVERIDSRPLRLTQLHAWGKKLSGSAPNLPAPECARLAKFSNLPPAERLPNLLGTLSAAGAPSLGSITRRWSLPPFWPSAWAFSTYLRKSGRKNRILRGA